MSEADRLAAALKQEQWAHTETAKRGTSYMVAAFDAEQARRIRAEERVEKLERAIQLAFNHAETWSAKGMQDHLWRSLKGQDLD